MFGCVYIYMKDQPTHYHLTKTNGTSDYTPVSTVLPVSKVKTKQEDTRQTADDYEPH